MRALLVALALLFACVGTGPRQVSDCCEVHAATCGRVENNTCYEPFCPEGELLFRLYVERVNWYMCSSCPLSSLLTARPLGNPLVCLP